MKDSIISMVIDAISHDQGWEETGDYYRTMFGLQAKYEYAERPNNDLKIKNINKRLGDIENKLGEANKQTVFLQLKSIVERLELLEDKTEETLREEFKI